MAFPKYHEKIGMKLNHLTVVSAFRKDGVTYAEVLCDCGTSKTTRLHHFLDGDIKSCGCTTGENNRKHDGKGTRLYRTWANMRGRCSNPNHKFYHRYGGRGITVCGEWGDFEVFRDWAMANGYNEELSIERIDNDSGYNPENCKWIPMSEQGQNKSNTRKVKIGKHTYTIKSLMRLYSIDYNSARSLFLKFSGKVKKYELVGIHKEVIKEAFLAGHIVKDIANYYRRSTKTITSILIEMGIRQGRAKGGRSGMSVLTESDVLEIRRLRSEESLTYKKLSEMFNVSLTNIESIIKRITWRHI